MRNSKRFDATIKISGQIFHKRTDMSLREIKSYFPDEHDGAKLLDVKDSCGTAIDGIDVTIKRVK